jgi:hypothetical protein
MDGPDKPLILYGAGKFSPSGKHELAVPTCSMSRACAARLPTIMVDEFNTTKVCSKCDTSLHPVATVNEQGQLRSVRGLRRCSSNVCAQSSFKNRDLNAALNILRCSPDRPISLNRGSIHPSRESWVLRRLEF